ncbi:MAG: 4Fe-4S cluster-binding domain-containing protein [Candidatus Omnitrophica bacterium]|nr:4Fe-4S cluster-binding domain-containing protein [Candidatus Omnitrophota bacterium]
MKLVLKTKYFLKLISDCFSHLYQKTDEVKSFWLRKPSVLRTNIQSQKNVFDLGNKPLILRWSNTSWCNYSCSYCSQNHLRSRKTHAFDAYSPDQWLENFDRHFSSKKIDLYLTITGGEPMIDLENMPYFLERICIRDYLSQIRIDTNLSFSLDAYSNIVSKDKIWLMCTYHPCSVKEEVFFSSVIKAQDQGFKIGICNYVITNDNYLNYEPLMRRFLKYDIPLNPNPLWQFDNIYDSSSIAVLKRFLPEKDFRYRSGQKKTQGKKCLFPALAYEMKPDGEIYVACHRAFLSGNFIKDKRLKRLFNDYTNCISLTCKCLDKYSFLRGFNRNYCENTLLSYKLALLDLFHNQEH